MRGKGEGSIRKRKDGIWEARYCAGRDPKTGKLIRKSIYGKTRLEIKERLSPILAALDTGTYIEPAKLTLGAWLNQWLWSVKKDHVKPKTFGWYEEVIRNHIDGSALAKMKLADIRRFHIQKWADDKVKSAASPRAIGAAYSVIRSACNDAVRLGLISASYADKIRLPKARAAETKILSQSEQDAFMNAIKGHRLETAFFVAITTGARQGEITALTWEDFDQDTGVLRICRNAIRVNEYDEQTHKGTGSRLIIQDSPKTAAGFRTIPLLPETVQALQKHRARQLEEKMKNRLLYVDNGLIFCDEIGRLYDPKNFYTRLRKICENAGIKRIKFHALRHTFATRALESEMSGKAVQGILGHETADMTLHYTHLLEEQKRKEMDKLKGVFTKGG